MFPFPTCEKESVYHIYLAQVMARKTTYKKARDRAFEQKNKT